MRSEAASIAINLKIPFAIRKNLNQGRFTLKMTASSPWFINFMLYLFWNVWRLMLVGVIYNILNLIASSHFPRRWRWRVFSLAFLGRPRWSTSNTRCLFRQRRHGSRSIFNYRRRRLFEFKILLDLCIVQWNISLLFDGSLLIQHRICIIFLILRLIVFRNRLSYLLCIIFCCYFERLMFKKRYLLYRLYNFFKWFWLFCWSFFPFGRDFHSRSFYYLLESINRSFFNLAALFFHLVFKQRLAGSYLDIFSIRLSIYRNCVVRFQRRTDSTINSFQLSDFIHQHSLILDQMQSYFFSLQP